MVGFEPRADRLKPKATFEPCSPFTSDLTFKKCLGLT